MPIKPAFQMPVKCGQTWRAALSSLGKLSRWTPKILPFRLTKDTTECV